MTYREFAKYIRKQTGTNSNTFTDADLLVYANIYKDELAKRIVRTKEDVFGMPMVIDLAINDDGSPQREYPLDPDSFQQVKYVEAKLDGVNTIPLTEMDLTGYRGSTDDADIANNFNNTKGGAFFDLFRGSLFIYSGTFGVVAQGLKLWTFQWPAKFTSDILGTDEEMSNDPSTTSAGFPREFQELLARRVIIAKKTESDKPVQLTDNEKKYDSDLAIALDEFSNHDPIFAALPEENRMDNGFNL